MDLSNLSPEVQEKAKNCKSPEELLSLAKEEGYELTNEELEAISGGAWLIDSLNDSICGKYVDEDYWPDD